MPTPRRSHRDASVTNPRPIRAISGDDEMKMIVAEIIEANRFTAKDMGTAMKLIMSKHGSAVDGKKVQTYLRERLKG